MQRPALEIAGQPDDPDTLALLRGVMDEVWAQLTEPERGELSRDLMARRLLAAVAGGERDIETLRTCAREGLGPLSS